MLIKSIDSSRLADHGRKVTVAMVDSGFSRVPSYAVLHGSMTVAGATHGDRMLSIFTALDGGFPIAGLTLHLACYNPASRYEGLATALRMVPECDILSLSMSWKDDREDVRREIEGRFGRVCVPFSANPLLPYPAAYGFATTCSNSDDARAGFCIRPNPEWHGNSYAVPAVARLFAHGYFDDGGSTQGALIGVVDAFSECRNGVQAAVASDDGRQAGVMACPNCHRYMRGRRTNGFAVLEHGTPCPYCGHVL